MKHPKQPQYIPGTGEVDDNHQNHPPNFELQGVIKPKEKALRYNEGKRRWSLVDFKSLEPMVQVLEFGSEKYEPDNWKKGFEGNDLLDCIMRHLVSIMDGETHDKESGLPHMGHIMCNAMFYTYFNHRNGK